MNHQDAIVNKQEEILKKCQELNDKMMPEIKAAQNGDQIDQLSTDLKALHCDLSSAIKGHHQSEMFKISELKDLITDNVKGNQIVTAVRAMLTCQLCGKVPVPGSLVMGKCCGQILGCSECTQRWLLEDESCHLCRKATDNESQVVFLKSCDHILEMLQ